MTFTDRAWLHSKRIFDQLRPGPAIDFDLQCNLHGRYSAFLLWALASRHTVRVRDNEASRLRHMLPFTTWLLRTVLERATPRATRATRTIVNSISASPSGAVRCATLDDDCFRPIDSAHELRAPYFMHPSVYRHALMRELPGLRTHPAKFLLGFAGSIGPTYGRVRAFGILSRPEVLDAAIAAFGSHGFAVREVTGKSVELLRSAFVHSITDLPADTVDKHAFGPRAYFSFVAECDFYLCAPGWTMPQSHNAIEAMAVGTIPVLNYPEYFDPPLRDGVNCIAFTTLEDLSRLPARLAILSAAQRVSMRQAVSAYYDQHLDGSAFTRALLAHPANYVRLFYNAEGDSVAKLEVRSGGARPLAPLSRPTA